MTTYVLLGANIALVLLVVWLRLEVNALRSFFDCLDRELHATQKIVCTDRELQFLNGFEGAYFSPEECGLRRFPKAEIGEVDGLSGWIVRLEPILPEIDPFDYSPLDEELFNADASSARDELNLEPKRITICLALDDEGSGKLRLVHASAKTVKDVEGAGEPSEH